LQAVSDPSAMPITSADAKAFLNATAAAFSTTTPFICFPLATSAERTGVRRTKKPIGLERRPLTCIVAPLRIPASSSRPSSAIAR
jgi:hypothetical protein